MCAAKSLFGDPGFALCHDAAGDALPEPGLALPACPSPEPRSSAVLVGVAGGGV